METRSVNRRQPTPLVDVAPAVKLCFPEVHWLPESKGIMSDKPTFENIDECVEYWRKHWRVPGIAVAVLHDGEVTAAGYGVSSIETEYPVSKDTLFQIGSISKVYTTSLVMTLVDEGLV